MKYSIKEIITHSVLFILTFFTVTISGVMWLNLDYTQLLNFKFGFPFSISILLILLTHEFGHFFAARFHKVEVSLPYFIPFPIVHFFLNFGTLGAVIKTKSPIPNLKALFDIGAYGPIAGFITSILILIFGFINLPTEDFILKIHPNYFSEIESNNIISLAFGSSLIFDLIKYLFTNVNMQFVPPMTEIYHYPFLCAGWFGIFMTMMNLIPIGQLDGGHIIYSLFPKQQLTIAKIFIVFLTIVGAIAFVPIFTEFQHFGWTGWLFWAGILFFIIKLEHPPVEDLSEINFGRKIIGWISIIIFFITFIPTPFPL